MPHPLALDAATIVRRVAAYSLIIVIVVAAVLFGVRAWHQRRHRRHLHRRRHR